MATVDEGPGAGSSNPHDALFKATFCQLEHAVGLLRSVLPARFEACMDWPTLAQVHGSFVDAHLLQRHSDLLFSVQLTGGGTALLYLLVEHQSEPDPWMPLRLFGYVDRIWQRWRQGHPEASRLPAVIPLVVHHGRAGWTAAESLGDLYDLDERTREMLAPLLPELRFVLDDLGRVEAEAIGQRPMTELGRLVLLCLKRARVSADIVSELQRWLDLIRRALARPLGRSAVAMVLRYVLGVTDAQPDRLLAMLEAGLGAEGKEAFMTGAQKLIEQGKVEGRAELMLRLLSLRFGTLDASVASRVNEAAPEQLDRWAERIFAAATLEELFASD